MARRVFFALLLALVWAEELRGSVLVPTYVLPPDSFVRDQRSLDPATDSVTSDSRTTKRLIGGHMKIKSDKEYGDPTKNLFAYDSKSDSGKFAGVVVTKKGSSGNVGWNQGIWDDGMLMSSAGEGKAPKTSKSAKDDDEEKKTLSDQVAEGKYGLIQNEIFSNNPKRPGIVSYESNAETRNKDNLQTLGGLKKDEIWLAEDHLLVLKGGSYPERTKDSDSNSWPPIDDYEAPRRQVKLPKKPAIPPPFPVRLSDDGPLVFLTPNGSVPAPLFPPYPPGASEGSLPFPPFALPPGATYAPSDDQGNSTAGGAPFQVAPFPYLPGNASEGSPQFVLSMNGSFPEGFPPGAAFLPPPSNQTDLYDEDDPSIYYPPPYNFSFHAENKSYVAAGPLVPGIVLPPPPDFFAPLEEKTTTESITQTYPTTPVYMRPKPTYKPRPVLHRKPYKPTRPPTTVIVPTVVTEEPITVTKPHEVVTELTHSPIPVQVVEIPARNPVRIQNLPEEVAQRPKTDKPIHKTRPKLVSKPLAVSVLYDYPETYTKRPSTTPKPYVVFSVPEVSQNSISDNFVTTTPVPLRAYYSNVQKEEVPTTKLQPVYNKKPTENSVTSFYYFDEQPRTSPAPATYFDGRNYYKTIPVSQAPIPQNIQHQGQGPKVEVAYGSFDEADAFFLFPQKQGTRTLTQEYFSIQKPRPQPVFVQRPRGRPDFYQQIANIQQTLDLYSTKRPKTNSHRPISYNHKAKVTPQPVYQFSYQANNQPNLNFRAPKLDPEPFRPMISYSKPFNLNGDYNTATPPITPSYHQQYLIENVQVSTETPTASKYYPKTKTRDDDYVDENKEIRYNTNNRNHIQVQSEKPTPLIHSHNRPSTTPSPLNQGYYTKQDERYLDDVTKNSFDVFGKKIEGGNHDVDSLGVTPPLGTVRTPIDNNINLQYAYEIVDTQKPQPPSLDKDTVINDRYPRPPINPESESIGQVNGHYEQFEQIRAPPPSLSGDILVNDRYPRPTVEPESEFIPIPNPLYRAQYVKPLYGSEQNDLNRPNLLGDTAVNYKRPLPKENPDAEWISPGNAAGEGKPGSLVSYRLPGEGAHVYFLTPQAARERYRSQAYGR